MGNKSASFILIFIILSAALYLVTSFLHCQGIGGSDLPAQSHQGKKIRKDWISLNAIKRITLMNALLIRRVQITTQIMRIYITGAKALSLSVWYSPGSE